MTCPPAPRHANLNSQTLARRNNGYFIVSSVEGVSFQPRDVPTGPVTARLGAGQLIPGLEEVLAGMRPGSKRRALVPPSAGMPPQGDGD